MSKSSFHNFEVSAWTERGVKLRALSHGDLGAGFVVGDAESTPGAYNCFRLATWGIPLDVMQRAVDAFNRELEVVNATLVAPKPEPAAVDDLPF